MKKFDRDKIKEIVKKHNLKLLLLFGSQVSGKTHKFSDYDFGYLSDRELNFSESGSLEEKLRKVVGSENVESVDLQKINPLMKYDILKNNFIIYENPITYENYFTQSLFEYFEFSRLLKVRDELISEKINQIKSRA